MSTSPAQRPDADEHLIASGVDEEPVEANRRLFVGTTLWVVGALAAVYAAFHMLALNGVSIAGLTGGLVDPDFLPTFPMETWNFRIAHVAGALALGFVLFSARRFAADRAQTTPVLGWLAAALLVPAVAAFGGALSIAWQIAEGTMWNGMDPRLRSQEIWTYGVPLLVATGGAIVLSWVDRRERHVLSWPDVVLALCGFAVAAYLIAMYGTLMRNATGTPFAPSASRSRPSPASC